MSAEQLLPLLAAVGMADKVSDVAREFAALPMRSHDEAEGNMRYLFARDEKELERLFPLDVGAWESND